MNHEILVYAHQNPDGSVTEETTIPCDISFPHTVVWELGMIKAMLSGGIVQWRDLGGYDRYTGSLEFYTDEVSGPLVEKFIKKPVVWVLKSFGGFYPMGPGWDYPQAGLECGDLRFLTTKTTIKPNRDPRGLANLYKFEYIPEGISCLGSWPNEQQPDPCGSNPISLGGVSLPYPAGSFPVDANEKASGISTNGSSTILDSWEIPHGQITTMDLVLSVKQASNLHVMLLNNRAANMELNLSGIAGVFGQMYREEGDFLVGLADNKVKFTHIGFDQIRVVFKIQNVAVSPIGVQ